MAQHYCESFWDMKCLPRREAIRKYYLFVPNHIVTRCFLPRDPSLSMNCQRCQSGRTVQLVPAECTRDLQISKP